MRIGVLATLPDGIACKAELQRRGDITQLLTETMLASF